MYKHVICGEPNGSENTITFFLKNKERYTNKENTANLQ